MVQPTRLSVGDTVAADSPTRITSTVDTTSGGNVPSIVVKVSTGLLSTCCRRSGIATLLWTVAERHSTASNCQPA